MSDPIASLGSVADIRQGRYLAKDEMSETRTAQTPIPVHGANGVIGWTSKPMYQTGVPLVTCRGSNSGMVLWAEGPLWVSNNAMAIVPHNGQRKFAYYALLFRPPYSTVSGSAQPQITRTALSPYDCYWPQDFEQEAIANVLSALDDKIELNRRMNETLEGMAQAIFKDWFVDFGPTRRKLAGIADPVAIMGGLTPDAARATELAALFPDALGDDGLPMGWSNQQIGSLIEVQGGSTPSTSDTSLWEPAEHWWATPKDLSSMSDLALFSTERRISSAGLARITSGALPVGTVLLSSRAPIGYLAIAQVPVAINQGFIALKPNDVFGSAYLYLWCKANMDQIVANANGSTFQEISKKNFRPISSPLPADGALVTAFGKLCQPLLDRIVLAADENRTLAETRDYLLPKLMSGDVRVRDAEKHIEDAA